jgi:orotate phosphoribosyltransferase
MSILDLIFPKTCLGCGREGKYIYNSCADVFTTGSTIKEAAKVLKKAGIEKVWGMTIAR